MNEKTAGLNPDGSKIEVEIPSIGRPGCANCAYAILKVDTRMASEKPAAVFECRRHAPRPGQLAAWPEVRPDDWCGMHCSREEYAASEHARREALGAARLLRDLFDPSKSPPENLNG